MSPVQLLLRPSHGSICFFLFLSRFLQLCQSNNISCSFFLVFFVFLFLGLLGEIFTLTNIHWHSFHPSTFYIDFFIELLILATEPSEKMYSKNSFITHLFRHSIGLMFYWYAEVLVPYIQRFGSCSSNLESLKFISNIKHVFFKNGLFKQHFVVQRMCLSQGVCSCKKAILYPSRQDKIPPKKNVVFLWKKQILFCRMQHYSSWQLSHATDTAFLEEMLVFL